MPETRLMHNVTCHEQFAVAEAMLDGEIEYRRENHALAYRRLRDAVGLEDAPPYTVEGRLMAHRLTLANSRADRSVGASCFCAQAAVNS